MPKQCHKSGGTCYLWVTLLKREQIFFSNVSKLEKKNCGIIGAPGHVVASLQKWQDSFEISFMQFIQSV